MKKELISLFPDISTEDKPKMKRICKYSIKLVKEPEYIYTTDPVVRCPNDAADILAKFFEDADRESFVIVLLNIKHKVIGLHTVSVGSLTASIVHPREVFKPAIIGNAAAIMLAHNHPSGDPSPSREDINITRQLLEVGKILDIPVLDHIIIGDHKYISLREEGHIQ